MLYLNFHILRDLRKIKDIIEEKHTERLLNGFTNGVGPPTPSTPKTPSSDIDLILACLNHHTKPREHEQRLQLSRTLDEYYCHSLPAQ